MCVCVYKYIYIYVNESFRIIPEECAEKTFLPYGKLCASNLRVLLEFF